MTLRFLTTAAPVALSLGAACLPSAVAGQGMVQSLAPTDADLLAAQMRQLAANPRDLTALATAGELSLRLGDLSAAAALFARADKIDPRSGRVKAGMASVLVRSERPGEALRFYDQALAYGWPVERFAADRGLAYDLIGEQERAQRDYRLALKGGADDETSRRYALSLGISGRQAQALEQLDPLVRRQDRAAWRARAFVLAMTGDGPEAAKIATTMMPAGMAQGLAAFFGRLPTLSPVDRAFAVHFGEVYPTAERIADARLVPALVPLTPESRTAPVQAAAVVARSDGGRRDRRSRRERERDRRAASAVQVAQAQVQPLPQPPRPIVLAQARPVVQPLPRSTAASPALQLVQPLPRTAGPATATVAATQTQPLVQPLPRTSVPATTAVAQTQSLVQPAPRTIVPATASSTFSSAPTAAAARESDVRMAAGSPPDQSTPAVAATAAVVPSTVATTPVATSPATAVAARPFGPVDPSLSPVAPVETAAATERADSVLARIVASISIPASELGVAPVRPEPDAVTIPAAVARAPASPVGKRILAEASAKEQRDASVRRTVAERLTGDAEADEPATRGRRAGSRTVAATDVVATGTRRGAPADDAPAARSRRAAAGDDAEARPDPKARRAADRKALADKKAAADKKALADAEAAEKKAARARPQRIWVQVAGGANEGDLHKAWRAVQAKAPALAGKSGYSTPLRATNRVLTGPFKTEAEARAAVNQLAKQGVPAFTFTSDAGQDVKKLGPK